MSESEIAASTAKSIAELLEKETWLRELLDAVSEATQRHPSAGNHD